MLFRSPGPGLEPVSPALAGRFLTTAPPGKPWPLFLEYARAFLKIMKPLDYLLLTGRSSVSGKVVGRKNRPSGICARTLQKLIIKLSSIIQKKTTRFLLSKCL